MVTSRTDPARQQVMMRVELELGHEQPHGRVDTGDGAWRPFWGWLELMQTVEDALAIAAENSPAPLPQSKR